MIGILYAALLAMGQKDMKRLVAYTSMAHFGFIGLGIFAFTTQGCTGAVLYMVNHGLSTGALFLVVGMLIARGGSRMIADYGGVQQGRADPGRAVPHGRAVGAGAAGHVDVHQRVPGAAGHVPRHPAYAVIGTAGIILAALYILLSSSGSCTGRRPGWPPAGCATCAAARCGRWRRCWR